jgi:uncharacterized membrane protein YccC
MKKKIIALTSESLHWSAEKQTNLSQVVVATLGLAVPVAVGALFGQVQIGSVAALGGLALSNQVNSSKFSENLTNLFYAIVTGILAFILGSYLSGTRILSLILVPSIVFIAGFIGGISRLLIRMTTLFILFFIIATRFGGNPLIVASSFALGAIWTALLSAIMRPIFQKLLVNEKPPVTNQQPSSPKYSAKQLLNHWKKSLQRFAGWQYAVRITSCIIVAELIKVIWPYQRGYWILLIVAIVVQRDISKLLPRIFQRGAGTFIGVILSSLFIFFVPTPWLLVLIIGVLAAARVALRETNYLAYAAVMTPLVIILLDFGKASSWETILDRLLSTIVGCMISLIFGYYVWDKFMKSTKNEIREKQQEYV